MSSRIKVVAFDCDGVMFDTTRSNQLYYNRILAHFGRPLLTPEQFAFVHMHTVDAALDHLFPEPDVRGEADIFRRKMNYYELIPLMEIEPDLKPLLKKLRPNWKTAIATNRSDTMDRVLQEHGLEGCFDLVVSARDVPHPKPWPDPLLKILEYFQVVSTEIVYVGDSPLDEQAALAAGIPLVAYRNPALSAAYHVQRLREIEEIVGVPV
ncbi:MAG: HAD family hydrolase [Thermodesulfobacteriota bacterium]